MKHIRDSFVLNNGVEIPCIGYGTWRVSKEDAKKNVLEALRAGYRHIDTAAFYGNESGIGEAIAESELPREEIFLTSKVWNSDQGYEACKKSFASSLERLKTDYLDLFLIHWPVAYEHRHEWQRYVQETWRAMEELYEEGKIRAIGVSNFLPHHFEPLLDVAQVKPAVNQIEFHPGLDQSETLTFCHQENILVEGWAPLARGKIFEMEELQKLSKQYNKTITQITLRWELQKGILPLPKSSSYERMVENSQIFDFILTEEEMKAIDRITDCGRLGKHPDEVDF